MANVEQIRLTVNSLHDELRAVAEAVTPNVLHWQKDESTWSVAQILAHIAEYEQFFSDDVRRMRQEPGARFGRTMDHEQRLNAVKLTGTETVSALLHAIDGSQRKVLGELAQLSDDDLHTEGTNPKFGAKTIDWVIHHFIVEHLQKHIGQIRRTVDAY